MAMPTEGLLTNQFQIEVEWLALLLHLEVRGSPITSYNLQWDAGYFGLSWSDLTGNLSDYLQTSYIVSSSIVPSAIYKFRIRAQNKWGYSDWSSITTIKASTWPEVVAMPTTSIDVATGNVVVTWVAPNSRGSQIDQYVIEFQNSANINDWVQILDYCNGSSTTVVVTSQCSIPMSKFLSPVLNYSLGQTIIARVTAHNVKGYSSTTSLSSVGLAIA